MELSVDKKVLDRVRKLLALAGDSGATEAEASLAAERARAIMAEHGISNATIEAGGGHGEGRTKHEGQGFVSKRWHRDIMEALCEQSFVVADWVPGRKGSRGRWELWGRESAVTTVKVMHDYLVKTVHRAVRTEMGSTNDEVFMAAMGERIAERIHERHTEAMAAQKREAREKQAAARHPSASPGTALVVVLEDYAQKERDLNNDMRMGWQAGETERRRLAREAEYAQRIAERDARLAAREAERQRLRSEGVRDEVIEYMLDGFSRERAEAMVEDENSPEAKKQAEREERRRAKANENWERKWRERAEREAARMASPSYRKGRAVGDRVGLDAQIDQRETRKLEG